MTDTAIPIPDDLNTRMERQTQAFAQTMVTLGASTADDLERAATAVGRVWREHMEASAQRRRVRTMMPALTMRDVLDATAGEADRLGDLGPLASSMAEDVVRALASGYRHRPGYDPAWSPRTP